MCESNNARTRGQNTLRTGKATATTTVPNGHDNSTYLGACILSRDLMHGLDILDQQPAGPEIKLGLNFLES